MRVRSREDYFPNYVRRFLIFFTDHRIGLTLYKLEAFIDGDMDEMIDALILDERMKLLQSPAEES